MAAGRGRDVDAEVGGEGRGGEGRRDEGANVINYPGNDSD